MQGAEPLALGARVRSFTVALWAEKTAEAIFNLWGVLALDGSGKRHLQTEVESMTTTALESLSRALMALRLEVAGEIVDDIQNKIDAYAGELTMSLILEGKKLGDEVLRLRELLDEVDDVLTERHGQRPNEPNDAFSRGIPEDIL